MEKRLIAFVVISLIIIFTYPFVLTWLTGPPPPVTSSSVNTDQSEKNSKKTEAPSTPIEDIEAEEKTFNGKSAGETHATGDTTNARTSRKEDRELEEITKVIETDLYRVTLSNIGGTIKQWELKKYTETIEEKEEEIQLISPDIRQYPLSLSGSDQPALGKNIYSFDDTPLQLSENVPQGTVKMVFNGPEGRKISKEIRFYNDQYRVDLKIETDGVVQPLTLSLGTNFGIHDWGLQIGRNGGGITLLGSEVLRDTPGKMEVDEVVHEGNAKWFALQDKYFISALIPSENVSLGPITFRKKGEEKISAEVLLGKNDANGVHRFSLYAGPKEYDRLSALNVNLDESIDFGWFISGSWLPVRLIAKPIFYLLRFFYGFTHNYGVAIILVTIMVKVIFFPITRKSMKSMKEMSALQPKIAEIRKKWAKDKEKMNLELMGIYKKEKVNPLGGCFPMLIQIPVFISLYNILYTIIDLRHAPFFLWVTDLSAKDPYYVLPIVMGGTMFLQQYMQPTTMDSTQAKVMQFLPVIYTYFFLDFPSGLVLYWLVNNLLTIGQQYLINKDTPPLSKA
ncbi:MAG: membrane protein insertase YidC [Nitrospiria bacterium]